MKTEFKEALKTTEKVRNIFLQVETPFNLSIGETMTLVHIKRGKGQTLKEMKDNFLNAHKHMNKQNMEVRFAKVIASLNKKELINKTKSPKDKRVAVVTTTNKGKKAIKDFFNDANKLWEE